MRKNRFILPHEPEAELTGGEDALRDVRVFKQLLSKGCERKSEAYRHLREQGIKVGSVIQPKS